MPHACQARWLVADYRCAPSIWSATGKQ